MRLIGCQLSHGRPEDWTCSYSRIYANRYYPIGVFNCTLLGHSHACNIRILLCYAMKCDLHIHTIHSGMCTVPVLKRICRESYNDPREVYSVLKRKGMDLVTLTDHDSIGGAESLRRYTDFFLSEEVSCRMPSGTTVHIGVFDLTERQHIEIQRRRDDFVCLLAYLTERRLLFSVNHIFSSLTGRRALDDFAWVEGYVPALETHSGQMPAFHNRQAAQVARRLGKAVWAEATLMSCLLSARFTLRFPARATKRTSSPDSWPTSHALPARAVVIFELPATFSVSPRKCFKSAPGPCSSAHSPCSCRWLPWSLSSMRRYSPAAGVPASMLRQDGAPSRWNRVSARPRRFAHGRSQGRVGLHRAARSAFDAPPAPLARAPKHKNLHTANEPSGQWLALVFARYVHTHLRRTKPLRCFLCRRPFCARRHPDLSTCEAVQPTPSAL